MLRNHDDDGLNYVVSEGPKLANNHEEETAKKIDPKLENEKSLSNLMISIVVIINDI